MISLNSLKVRKLSPVGVISIALLCTVSMRAQTAGTPSQAPSQNDATSVTASVPQKPDIPSAKTDDAAAQKPMSPEEARRAQLEADTARLYQLAQELQTEVAKSTKNTLSLAVVKKAAEVEKLAKSLKERMKNE